MVTNGSNVLPQFPYPVRSLNPEESIIYAAFANAIPLLEHNLQGRGITADMDILRARFIRRLGLRNEIWHCGMLVCLCLLKTSRSYGGVMM